MKVVDMLKHRSESLSKQPFEIKEFMSPTLRVYWEDLVNKANDNPLAHWFREHQLLPAINEEQHIQEEVIELSPAAQAVYDELLPKLDEEIHVGDWVSISQDRINAFGEVTEDMQWIHTDPERASEESPFKTTVAHGFLTLSMLSRMTDSVDPENSLFPTARMVVNVGLNQVRFPYPVKSGDNIRTRSKLVKITPIKKGLEIEREMKVEIDGVRRPGCVVVSVIRLYF
ncbi:MaoC family dehydratase [Vibrio sp. SCSIO 43137]|uniref:MaoC family dehydratase n=1 Tax=Vibrio sp. SCSIO 43137 TaxID=3021011 RepID=UPI002307D50D|nr:MaoC family dehydratase [Vibrio sp. SCSIO 43137]WCE31509.1 MaoC family dehydratase [Vibrio sp. SCSIO 43137]